MDDALWKPVAGTAFANQGGGGPVVMWRWKRSVLMARTMKEVCLCLYNMRLCRWMVKYLSRYIYLID